MLSEALFSHWPETPVDIDANQWIMLDIDTPETKAKFNGFAKDLLPLLQDLGDVQITPIMCEFCDSLANGITERDALAVCNHHHAKGPERCPS